MQVRRGKNIKVTPSEARQAAGLTLEEAARLARVGQIYLRRVEKHGGASWVLCRRLSRLYGAPLDTFVYKKGGGGKAGNDGGKSTA